MGEPFDVQADTDEEGIETARILIGQRLTALETRARAMISDR
jgi:hypothetical protein